MDRSLKNMDPNFQSSSSSKTPKSPVWSICRMWSSRSWSNCVMVHMYISSFYPWSICCTVHFDRGPFVAWSKFLWSICRVVHMSGNVLLHSLYSSSSWLWSPSPSNLAKVGYFLFSIILMLSTSGILN